MLDGFKPDHKGPMGEKSYAAEGVPGGNRRGVFLLRTDSWNKVGSGILVITVIT
jgi:hypothetical protein